MSSESRRMVRVWYPKCRNGRRCGYHASTPRHFNEISSDFKVGWRISFSLAGLIGGSGVGGGYGDVYVALGPAKKEAQAETLKVLMLAAAREVPSDLMIPAPIWCRPPTQNARVSRPMLCQSDAKVRPPARGVGLSGSASGQVVVVVRPLARLVVVVSVVVSVRPLARVVVVAVVVSPLARVVVVLPVRLGLEHGGHRMGSGS
jgi:hypothetical protein